MIHNDLMFGSTVAGNGCPIPLGDPVQFRSVSVILHGLIPSVMIGVHAVVVGLWKDDVL